MPRPGVGPATFRSRVRRRTAAPPRQPINHPFAHNTSSNEAVRTSRPSRRDEQDSQAPGALIAALIKHTKFSKTVIVKRVQMSIGKSNKVAYNEMTRPYTKGEI